MKCRALHHVKAPGCGDGETRALFISDFKNSVTVHNSAL